MAKFKKAAAAFVLAAVAAVSLMFVGCSGGGKEVDGVYRYLTCTPSTIEQGWLTQNIFGGFTSYTDNTYSGFGAVHTMYSSDGSTYSPAYTAFYSATGSFEVVNEDDILNEKTIKITSVDKIVLTDAEYAYADLPAEAKEIVDTNIIGREVILTSDSQLSELPFDMSLTLSL